jgi:hypothetical protein
MELLEHAAVHALEATKRIGCRIVDRSTNDPVQKLLTAAWEQFWEDPLEYPAWERDAIAELKVASLHRKC